MRASRSGRGWWGVWRGITCLRGRWQVVHLLFWVCWQASYACHASKRGTERVATIRCAVWWVLVVGDVCECLALFVQDIERIGARQCCGILSIRHHANKLEFVTILRDLLAQAPAHKGADNRLVAEHVARTCGG